MSYIENDDCCVSCSCNNKIDIRGRCDPIRSPNQFSKCPLRVDTTYFHICNDYEKYKDIEASFSRREKYQKIFKFARKEPYFLKDYLYSCGESLLDEMLTELIEQDEENEGYCDCVICNNFISLAEQENEAKTSNSQEGLVCLNCSLEHYCDYCDDIADDFGKVFEFEGKLICDRCYEEENKPRMKCERKDKYGNICQEDAMEGNEYCSDCMEQELGMN